MINRNFSILALFALFALAACGGGAEQATPAMTAMGDVQPYTEPEVRFANPGSIYADSSSGLLFEDTRARRIGDLVLIKIVENSKASNKANTTAERQSDVDVGVSAAFGRSKISPFIFGGLLAGKIGTTPIVGATTKLNHEASGETKRENSVTTTIGGRVVNVLPNGVLEIAAGRSIKVNGETEYMVVRGLVRTSDILSDNSVLSTQLANSSIEYFGQGAIADKQNPGWLSRVVDIVWPF